MFLRQILNTKRGLAMCLFTALLLPLASCAEKGKIDPLAGGGGLSGSWVSGDNVFTAELRDGQFVSRANDTGEVLTQGSYIVSSAESITLQWRSSARGEDSRADCRRDSANSLNCTDQAGRTFTLRKISS